MLGQILKLKSNATSMLKHYWSLFGDINDCLFRRCDDVVGQEHLQLIIPPELQKRLGYLSQFMTCPMEMNTWELIGQLID